MASSRLLLATNNAHKVTEFRRLLTDIPHELVTPADIGLSLDVEETGTTFEENATLKAEAFAEASGLLSLADDSGIEVEVLDGRPGVESARHGGVGLSDEDRMLLLLKEMVEVPDRARSCRYRVVLVLAHPDGTQQVTQGTCVGRLAHKPEGANGFGYDPIFYIPMFERTIAQLTPEEKDSISHRGQAARAMAALLMQ
ncbi:MAG: RdgB/HAM1 family non-canonical purine NTP pyrophosphatase [Dehalococcoidia bacterium]